MAVSRPNVPGFNQAKKVAVVMQADEDVSLGDVVRNVAGITGHIEKAASTEGNAIGIVQHSVNSGSSASVIKDGLTKVNFVSAPPASHNGKPVFLSTTDGLCQVTAPTQSGTSIIQIGYLISGDGSTTTPQVFVDIRVIAYNS